MRLFCFQAALLLLLTGCGEERDLSFAPFDTEPETLYFEPVTSGYHASHEDTLEAVIRNDEAWQEHLLRLRPHRPVPPVDFSQVMLFVVGFPVSESGHSITFDVVERFEEEVVAEYMVLAPSGDCLTTAAEGFPFQVVQVRRVDEPVRFERTRHSYSCR